MSKALVAKDNYASVSKMPSDFRLDRQYMLWHPSLAYIANTNRANTKRIPAW